MEPNKVCGKRDSVGHRLSVVTINLLHAQNKPHSRALSQRCPSPEPGNDLEWWLLFLLFFKFPASKLSERKPKLSRKGISKSLLQKVSHTIFSHACNSSSPGMALRADPGVGTGEATPCWLFRTSLPSHSSAENWSSDLGFVLLTHSSFQSPGKHSKPIRPIHNTKIRMLQYPCLPQRKNAISIQATQMLPHHPPLPNILPYCSYTAGTGLISPQIPAQVNVYISATSARTFGNQQR